jgi:hypothetical protein
MPITPIDAPDKIDRIDNYGLDNEPIVEATDSYADAFGDEKGIGEVFLTGLRHSTTVGSMWRERSITGGEKPEAVDGYDIFGINQEELKGYEIFSKEFVESESPEETAMIKRLIDKEQEDRRILQDAGAAGVISEMVAGMADPIFLLMNFAGFGSGFIARGSSLVGKASRAAVVGMASEIVSETALHNSQRTRTIQESMINIGGASILSGVFGAASHKLSTRKLEKMGDDLERAVTDVNPEMALNGKDILSPEDFDLAFGFGFESLPFSPLARAHNATATAPKQLIGELMETPFFTKGQKKGLSTTPTGGSVETRIKAHDDKLSTFFNSVSDFYGKYRKGGRQAGEKLYKFDEIRIEAGKAARRGDTHPIPEVAEMARSFRRTIVDPLTKMAQDLKLLPEKLDVQTATSYLTRLYNTSKINANRGYNEGQWDRIVYDWIAEKRGKALAIDEAKRTDAQKSAAALTDEKIRGEVIQITSDISGGSFGKNPNDLVKLAKPFERRTFLIDDHLIEDYLESDIEMISKFFIRSVAPQVEIKKQFGSIQMNKQIDDIITEYQNLIIDAPSARKKKKLAKEQTRIVRDFEAMRDRLIGTYKQPNDPNSFAFRALDSLRDFNYVRMLGAQTVSAIVDPARIVATNGLVRTSKTLLKIAGSPRRFNMSRHEMKKMAIGLDMQLNSRAFQIGELSDVHTKRTFLEKTGKKSTEMFSKITLMSQWNSAWKQLAGVMTSDRILSEAANWSKGKISKANRTRLAHAGINEKMAARITKMYEKHGSPGSIKLSNAFEWAVDDLDAFETFKASVLKDADRTIVTPGKGETPLWSSGPVGKTIFQFKSFAAAAHHKILVSSLQSRDAASLNGFLISIALGSLSYSLKEALAGRELTDDPKKFLVESMDKSGAAGYMWDAELALQKFSEGKYGLNSAMGIEDPMSRSRYRNKVESFFGPSFGTVKDLVDVGGAISTADFTDADARKIRKLMPAQNLFYMRWLFDKFEEGLTDLLE